jgi:hypothetical protein
MPALAPFDTERRAGALDAGAIGVAARAGVDPSRPVGAMADQPQRGSSLGERQIDDRCSREAGSAPGSERGAAPAMLAAKRSGSGRRVTM